MNLTYQRRAKSFFPAMEGRVGNRTVETFCRANAFFFPQKPFTFPKTTVSSSAHI